MTCRVWRLGPQSRPSYSAAPHGRAEGNRRWGLRVHGSGQQRKHEIARRFGINRYKCGEYIEEVKVDMLRGSSSAFGYRELEELARRYLADGGK
jgi:hypothetical protein